MAGQFGTDVVPQGNSAGDSSGSGLAEHGVKDVKAKARSLAHAVSVMLQVTLDPKHTVVTWLAQWTAMTVTSRRNVWMERHLGRGDLVLGANVRSQNLMRKCSAC